MVPAANSDPAAVARILQAVTAEDHGRLLAALARRFHDLDLAEDVLQEAVLKALEVWPVKGVPHSPQAWLMTTAKNRALDLIRADSHRARHLARLRIEDELREHDSADHADRLGEEMSTATIGDERLGLFFTCAHPTLRTSEQIALILRFLAGLTTAEVAAAFLVDTTTMQQRIVRAKKRIRVTGIPFGRPTDAQLRQRLPGVLRVVYLIFTQGFVRTEGAKHYRMELLHEAISLARTLAGLLPDETEVRGLLALLLLTRARNPGRMGADGEPVPLPLQDRGQWDSAMIVEGLGLARQAASEAGAGTYTVQSTIAALHAEAPTFAQTDWEQILILYRYLYSLDPSPVVALSMAVATARAKGPDAGLLALETLASDGRLQRFRPFHIARAITLREAGLLEAAETAYRDALGCPGNDSESVYLETQIRTVSSGRAGT